MDLAVLNFSAYILDHILNLMRSIIMNLKMVSGLEKKIIIL